MPLDDNDLLTASRGGELPPETVAAIRADPQDRDRVRRGALVLDALRTLAESQKAVAAVAASSRIPAWARLLFSPGGVNVAALIFLWIVSVAVASSTLSRIDYWAFVQSGLVTTGATLLLLAGIPAAMLYLKGRLSARFAVPYALGFLVVWGGSVGAARHEQASIRSSLNETFLGYRWVAYDPPTFDPYPESQRVPTEDEIRRDLVLLRDEKTGPGSDGIITFKSNGVFAQIPRLAKEIGFRRVVMGIFITNDENGNPTRPTDQIDAAIAAKDYVDGYCLGHNPSTRLDISRLKEWMHDLRTRTGKPVTTTAPLVCYLGERGKDLREIGDWYMPDVHGSWTSGGTPKEVFQELRQALRDVTTLPRDKPVMLKMVSCPSGGAPAFSEESQAEFFTWISRDLDLPPGVIMTYYNGFDLPWMSADRHPDEWSRPQQYVGFFTADGRPKKAVAVIRNGFPIQTRP